GHASEAVHGGGAGGFGGRRACPPRQRIAPRFTSRGSRVTAASSGQRRCQGLSSILVPACRLIFQARYSTPPAKVKLALASLSTVVRLPLRWRRRQAFAQARRSTSPWPSGSEAPSASAKRR